MPFPLSYENRIEVPFDTKKHTPDNLLKNIESSLKKADAINIQKYQNYIVFSGGIFRFWLWNWSWNSIVGVSRGIIAVEKDKDKLILKYHLNFRGMLMVVSVLVFGFFGALILENQSFSFAYKIALLGSFWIWIFGGSYLITIRRFPSLLKKMTESK